MEKKLASHSKFLSLILRHSPETIGICLDENGWVAIDQLLEASQAHGRDLDHEILMRVVRENDKQRFAISDDGQHIRANQGHSVSVNLQLQAQQPPSILFHGTVAKFIEAIKQQGLISGARQYVHLSPDQETARIVGSRRGQPIILSIDTVQMSRAGYSPYSSAGVQ